MRASSLNNEDQSVKTRTILTNATLIDCVDPKPVADAAIVIENGRITEILSGGRKAATGDATVIDLKGAYLMPGLWDVHIHPDYLSLAEMPLADQVTLFGHRLAAGLTESGIVGFRCAGAHHYMDVAWKRAFDSGQHLGPRLFASGHFLTTTGGHFLTSGHALEVDGPYGWVKAIREQIKNGVDHIKLNLSGGIMGPAWDLHTHSFLLDDELRAAFEICRQRGFKVMAHATDPDALKNAIRLGAHSVEHGYIMDDECIALLLEHDTWYVPTLAISHLTASQATNRFEAAWVAHRGLSHLLGLDEVPCIVLAHLMPTQRRAYVLADNKLALNAGWDLEMLSLEIGELGEAGFDLSLTGFDEFELGELFAERTQGRTDPEIGR